MRRLIKVLLALFVLAPLASVGTWGAFNTAFLASELSTALGIIKGLAALYGPTGWANHLPGCTAMWAFGAVGDGVTDNAPAWNAAIAVKGSTSQCISWDAGKFHIASNVSATFAKGYYFRMTGSGIDQTVLSFASGAGMTLTGYDSTSGYTIDHMTFAAEGVGVGNGLTINSTNGLNAPAQEAQAISNITEVVFRGADAYAGTDYFAIDLILHNMRYVNLNNVSTWGSGVGLYGYVTGNDTGIYIYGDGGTYNIPVQFNTHDYSSNYNGKGISIGPWTQGVIVDNGNFLGDKIGVAIESTNPVNAVDQVTISNTNFNCEQYGFLDAGGSIGLQFVNNYFLIPPINAGEKQGGTGILLGGTGHATASFTVVGNTFQSLFSSSSANYGFAVNNGATMNGNVVGNLFSNLTQAVWLKTTTRLITVADNTYNGNGTNLTNQGGSPSGNSACPASPTSNCISYTDTGTVHAGTISSGSPPTLTTGSCSGSSAVGGATGGTFVAASCSAGTYIISSLPTAPNGWACFATDRTTTTDTLIQSATSATSATLRSTTAASDVIQYSCTGY